MPLGVTQQVFQEFADYHHKCYWHGGSCERLGKHECIAKYYGKTWETCEFGKLAKEARKEGGVERLVWEATSEGVLINCVRPGTWFATEEGGYAYFAIKADGSVVTKRPGAVPVICFTRKSVYITTLATSIRVRLLDVSFDWSLSGVKTLAEMEPWDWFLWPSVGASVAICEGDDYKYTWKVKHENGNLCKYGAAIFMEGGDERYVWCNIDGLHGSWNDSLGKLAATGTGGVQSVQKGALEYSAKYRTIDVRLRVQERR